MASIRRGFARTAHSLPECVKAFLARVAIRESQREIDHHNRVFGESTSCRAEMASNQSFGSSPIRQLQFVWRCREDDDGPFSERPIMTDRSRKPPDGKETGRAAW